LDQLELDAAAVEVLFFTMDFEVSITGRPALINALVQGLRWRDVAHRGATLAEFRAVGIIDMASAIGCGAKELTVDTERAGHSAEIIWRTHGQELFGF
jgi:hypothetical protein